MAEGRRCMLHPENECHPDAQGRCACAPPGMAHATACAVHRGERCDCEVSAVSLQAACLYGMDDDLQAAAFDRVFPCTGGYTSEPKA